MSTTAGSHRNTIHPAIVLPLDAATRRLASRVLLALACRQPAALPFVCAVDAGRAGTNRARDREARTPMTAAPLEAAIARAFAEVTDLREREEAILWGHAVEDQIRVFLCFTLGAPEAEPQQLHEVLETLHRVARDHFGGSGLEAHAVTLVPHDDEDTLAESAAARTYRQLQTIEGLCLHGPGAVPGAGLDFAWLLECRTRAGGHVADTDEVSDAAAHMLATLIQDPTAAAASAPPGRTGSRHLERAAVYSSFGIATVDFRPDAIVRLVAARLASEILGRYAPEDDGGTGPVAGRLDPAMIEQAVATWAERVGLRDLLAGSPAAAAPRPDTGPDTAHLLEAVRQRAAVTAALRDALHEGVREWLDAGGVPLAAACHAALAARDVDREGGGPVPAAHVSLYRLYADLRDEIAATGLPDALDRRVEELRERERTLLEAHPEGGAVEPASAPGPDLEELREAIAELEAARQALAGMTIAPDLLERLVEEHGRAGPLNPAPPPEPPPPPPPPPRSRGGLLDWFRKRLRRRPGGSPTAIVPDVPPAGQPPASSPGAPTPVTVATPPAPPARALAERLRRLRLFERILGEVRDALREHESDAREAYEYYDRVASESLERAARNTAFSITPLTKAAIERIAADGVTRAREILERDGKGFAFLATRFRLEPTPLREHALRVVERLQGWDERVTTAAHEAMAEFSGRSLGDIVADEAYRPGRGLADFARMLLEASEPLARPGPVTAERLWAPARWARGDGDFLGLLRQDAESARVLEAAGVVLAPGPPSSAAFLGSFIHGFPAQALYRVAAYRAAAVRAGPPDPDLISNAALLEDPTGPLVRTLVLARCLGLARRTADGIEFRGAVLPDDLLEAARRLLFSHRHRPLVIAMGDAVDASLREPDALDRLRRLAAQDDLAPVERTVILEMIADLARQRAGPDFQPAPATQNG